MKLSDVPELMVEKKGFRYKPGSEAFASDTGFNQAISQQGQVEVELDKSKISDSMIHYCGIRNHLFIDWLNSNLHKLLKVKK